MNTPSENENRPKFTPEQLAEILRLHKMWWRREPGGARANLADADLAGANLVGANLADADLGGADLAGADLGGAYLADADLGGAYLGDAYLGGAYLGGARGLTNPPADPPIPYVRPTSSEEIRAAR